MKSISQSAVTLLILVNSQCYGAGLAHSPNFIVSADDQALADAVLAKAETCRNDLAQEWLGDKLPVDAKRVVIHVILSKEKDFGLTRIEEDKDENKCHSVWIVTSSDRINSTLAHEMTHIVFGCKHHKRIPIWANEGAASLQDDPERIGIRRRIIADLAQKRNWPDLITILESSSFLTSDQLSYSVSASVTQFLLSLDTKPTFLQFTVDGKAKGWDAALSRHYGMRNIRELQARWQEWVQQDADLRPVETVYAVPEEFNGQTALLRHLPFAPVQR